MTRRAWGVLEAFAWMLAARAVLQAWDTYRRKGTTAAG